MEVVKGVIGSLIIVAVVYAYFAFGLALGG